MPQRPSALPFPTVSPSVLQSSCVPLAKAKRAPWRARGWSLSESRRGRGRERAGVKAPGEMYNDSTMKNCSLCVGRTRCEALPAVVRPVRHSCVSCVVLAVPFFVAESREQLDIWRCGGLTKAQSWFTPRDRQRSPGKSLAPNRKDGAGRQLHLVEALPRAWARMGPRGLPSHGWWAGREVATVQGLRRTGWHPLQKPREGAGGSQRAL